MKDWLTALFLSTLAILAPIKPLCLAVAFLILVDTVTGIWAAKKRGEQLKSSKLRSILTKMFVYQLCVISGFVLENYILDHLLPVAKLIAGAAAVVEVKSILENSNFILGMDIFAEVKKRLGSPNQNQ